LKSAALLVTVAGLLSTSQVAAFDTQLERIGMLYLSVPLSGKSLLRSPDTAIGMRLGRLDFSSDPVPASLRRFARHPSMIEIEFRPTGYVGDIAFGLQEFRLNGIDTLEKRSLANHQGEVITGVSTTQLAIGAAAIGGAVILIASSGSDSDSEPPAEQPPAEQPPAEEEPPAEEVPPAEEQPPAEEVPPVEETPPSDETPPELPPGSDIPGDGGGDIPG
jgi:hypothetical protein